MIKLVRVDHRLLHGQVIFPGPGRRQRIILLWRTIWFLMTPSERLALSSCKAVRLFIRYYPFQ